MSKRAIWSDTIGAHAVVDEKEWTLGSKIYGGFNKDTDPIRAYDVKEFIRRLKSDFCYEATKSMCTDGIDDGSDQRCTNCKIIDKLAGEELI